MVRNMKCSNCNFSWSLFDAENQNFDNCPKCQKKFIAKFQNYDSISEGIGYCLKIGSKDMLKYKAKMNSYISDLMGNSFPDRNLIKNAVESGIGSILLDADTKSQQEKQAAISQAVGQMVREFSTDQRKAEEVVSYFTEALGWKNVKTTTGNSALKFEQNINVRNRSKNASFVHTGSNDIRNANAVLQQYSQASGNFSPQGNPTVFHASFTDDAQTKTAVILENAIVVKKKTPLKWMIPLILFFLLAISVIMFLLLYKPEETPVIAEVLGTVTETVTETELTTEIQTDPTTESETEVGTLAKTDASTTTATTTFTTVISTEEIEEDTLTIKNLCSVLGYKEDAKPEICYDPFNQRLYFKDGNYKISYYSLENETTGDIIDTANAEIYLCDFSVNPYNGKLYVMLYDGLYDVESDRIVTERVDYNSNSHFTFISENELVYGDKKISLDTGEIVISGIRPLSGNRDIKYNAPFMDNGECYYFLYGYPFTSYIVKSPQILTPDGSYSNKIEFEDEYKAFFVDSNALYYMTQDNSIYRFNPDNAGNSAGYLNKNNPDILIFDGNEMQSVKSGYISNGVIDFVKVNDTCFIFFDAFDKTAKMVSYSSATQ